MQTPSGPQIVETINMVIKIVNAASLLIPALGNLWDRLKAVFKPKKKRRRSADAAVIKTAHDATGGYGGPHAAE